MEGGQMRLVKKQLQHLDLRLGRNEWSKFHKQKTKIALIFTVLGHVVEVQCVPETCQLHLQNWQNWTFHNIGR